MDPYLSLSPRHGRPPPRQRHGPGAHAGALRPERGRRPALVIGTSNRTETLLGYTTIFGDNAAAIQPIADLFKCQVRELARAVGVPESIVAKAPSADLWAGQTDEGELGFTYDQADQVLHLLYDQRFTAAGGRRRAGFDLALVQRIQEIVRRNQFKRQTPPIAKVSPRTVGVDFQYARDWGT